MNIVTDEMDDFWFESLGWNEDVVVEDTINHLKEVEHLEMKAELHYGI